MLATLGPCPETSLFPSSETPVVWSDSEERESKKERNRERERERQREREREREKERDRDRDRESCPQGTIHFCPWGYKVFL